MKFIGLCFDCHDLMYHVARVMKARAQCSTFHGISNPLSFVGQHDKFYLNYCSGVHETLGTKLIFTRDEGYHSSGWWKNPDYERCYHLSLSFFDIFTGEPGPRNEKLTAQWVDAFFGENKKFVWCEPPYSPDGLSRTVWHYRLFCDPAWQPIHPRGEVYSKTFTEKGWKSFSEIMAAQDEQLRQHPNSKEKSA